MTEGHIQVVLDLYYQVDEEEFQNETGTEHDKISWGDIQGAVIEQIEEAVKESGHGTSIQLSFADENTEVRRYE